MKVLSLPIASTFIAHRKYLRFSSHIFPVILTSLDKAKITMNNTAEEALLLT